MGRSSVWSVTLTHPVDADNSLPSGPRTSVRMTRDACTETTRTPKRRPSPSTLSATSLRLPPLSPSRELPTELPNTALLSEFFAPPRSASSASDRTRTISWKSRLTVVMSLPRSSGPKLTSSRRSTLLTSSPTTSALTPSVLPEVRVCRVLSRDTDARDSRENLTEVSERSDVSEPGIPLPSSGPLEDVVVWGTTPEPRSTRNSTELLLVSSVDLPTTLLAKLMPSRRTSPPWVASLTTLGQRRFRPHQGWNYGISQETSRPQK